VKTAHALGHDWVITEENDGLRRIATCNDTRIVEDMHPRISGTRMAQVQVKGAGWSVTAIVERYCVEGGWDEKRRIYDVKAQFLALTTADTEELHLVARSHEIAARLTYGYKENFTFHSGSLESAHVVEAS